MQFIRNVRAYLTRLFKNGNKNSTILGGSRPIPVKILEDKKWRNQDILTIAALLVSITTLLYTNTSNQINRDANQISHEALLASRKNDSLNRIQQKRHDNMDSIKWRAEMVGEELKQKQESMSVVIASRNLKAQIDFVDMSKSHFESNNIPYLQCDEFKVQQFEPNMKLTIGFRIKNLGNYPAEVFKRRFWFNSDKVLPKEDPYYKLTDFTNDTNTYSTFITKEYPEFGHFTSTDSISVTQYEQIVSGKLKLYFGGTMIFKNPLTKKDRKFSFMALVYPPDFVSWSYLSNKQDDITK